MSRSIFVVAARSFVHRPIMCNDAKDASRLRNVARIVAPPLWPSLLSRLLDEFIYPKLHVIIYQKYLDTRFLRVKLTSITKHYYLRFYFIVHLLLIAKYFKDMHGSNL